MMKDLIEDNTLIVKTGQFLQICEQLGIVDYEFWKDALGRFANHTGTTVIFNNVVRKSTVLIRFKNAAQRTVFLLTNAELFR